MQLPPVNRISLEAYKDIDEWGIRLIGQLNDYLPTIYNGLNKNITLEDNIRSQQRIGVSYRTAADYTTNGTFTPITFPNQLKGGVVAQHMELSKATRNNNPYAPYPNPIILGNWQDVNGVITIYKIFGLENNTQYTFNFLIF
jgi:hypothetical protein